MESSTTFLASLMDQARLTLLGVQTEIIIFVVAFMMHGLFFRRLKVPGKGHGKQGRLKEEVSQNSEREPAGTSLRSHSAMQFAQMAERLCNIRSFQQMIAELSGELEPVRLVNFLKAVGKDRNFPANATTYNTIVKAYLQAKRYSDARHTVESMKATGFRPNGATYNEVLQYNVKTSMEDAWLVLDEMRAAGIKPNRVTYSILLKAVQTHPKHTDVDRLMSILCESEEELDEVLLCSVVDACISAGRADVLISQLKGQWSKVPIKGSRTYANIIRAYGFVHDLAECWSTWREMRTRHIQPCAVTLGCMVEALVTNGDVDAGYELINEMLRDHEWAHLVNAVVYCSVLKGYSHQKNFDRMWHVYQEMLQHKLKFSIVTFNTLVDACSRNGQMHRIPAMLDDMDTQGISPNIITYSAIIKGYCQAGRINDAFSVLEGMVQNTRFTPDEIMYNTLLDGCARQGMVDRGMEVLKRMESDRVPPSNFTLSVLVKLCNRGKRLDKSFDLCQAISLKHKFRLNVHVYSNLIHGCIAHKDIDRALGVLEKMMCESVRPNARTYTILITACVEGKRAQDAAGLVRAAFGFAHVHPRLSRYDRKMLLTQGGNLSAAVLTEILEGIAGPCNSDQVAIALLKDLRTVSGLRLDPKLQFRLATSAFNKQGS
mmetsp:Transcript_110060/g.173941  ORF Transcript_110060/g.173941 Transcript_110060/m.173941 type:complete len:658 (-) Transcript_110060:53-2026(-)